MLEFCDIGLPALTLQSIEHKRNGSLMWSSIVYIIVGGNNVLFVVDRYKQE